MGVVENKITAEKFSWFGNDKLYRALNELAKINRKDIMALVRARNNKDLCVAFTYHKECLTISMIEQMAYLLRNVDGWSLDAILHYIKTGNSNSKPTTSSLELAIARKLYKNKKVAARFFLNYLYDKKFTDEEMEMYRNGKSIVSKLKP